MCESQARKSLKPPANPTAVWGTAQMIVKMPFIRGLVRSAGRLP
jgi:hypothetical protein